MSSSRMMFGRLLAMLWVGGAVTGQQGAVTGGVMAPEAAATYPTMGTLPGGVPAYPSPPPMTGCQGRGGPRMGDGKMDRPKAGTYQAKPPQGTVSYSEGAGHPHQNWTRGDFNGTRGHGQKGPNHHNDCGGGRPKSAPTATPNSVPLYPAVPSPPAAAQPSPYTSSQTA